MIHSLPRELLWSMDPRRGEGGGIKSCVEYVDARTPNPAKAMTGVHKLYTATFNIRIQLASQTAKKKCSYKITFIKTSQPRFSYTVVILIIKIIRFEGRNHLHSQYSRFQNFSHWVLEIYASSLANNWTFLWLSAIGGPRALIYFDPRK